jgi:hypothetical protein
MARERAKSKKNKKTATTTRNAPAVKEVPSKR